MDTQSAGTEFVTVVSVQGSVQQPTQSSAPSSESFVTVLAIGQQQQQQLVNGIDPAHPEEEVEVYRLPGERLGFGLKFEGGNKTSERVRRLFIQSCAEQSPASRATCSWGHLGEGDEVLLIDGVPVTQMTRLDCVRRLKESQLVIRLMVRCRGALRPEVVSAERKERSKVPPELPAAPPPVPPRKLRHSHSQANRGSADGEASPGSKQSWDSPKSTGSSSQAGSPRSIASYRSAASCSARSSNYDSCSSSPAKMPALGKNDNNSPKGSPKVQMSPVLNCKAKQELSPAEAQSYLDARSQDGSSTHGSTSDDTSSSLSTVVDRLDRFSTTSTTSTTSMDQQQQQQQQQFFRGSPDLSSTNGVDFLLSRLANSEARTHVESRGDVERVTAVVAPNTVLIEETPTLQPPLSFQDAPLSYGHEPRPGIFYSADLAADSRTHFRPIKDDADVVEKVVNGHEAAPPLPVRNHVNRIPIVQEEEQENREPKTPVLPPKPMPRKDVKSKRKRPPPPPPPPRREPMPIPEARILDTVNDNECETIEVKEEAKVEDALTDSRVDEVNDNEVDVDNTKDENANEQQTNKILELVDMKIQNSLSRISDDDEIAEREVDDDSVVDVELMNSINENSMLDEEDMVDVEKVEVMMMMDRIVKEHEQSDESDDGDDYYWQSNLATIGEEEENNSLEYENANEVLPPVESEQTDVQPRATEENRAEDVREVVEKKDGDDDDDNEEEEEAEEVVEEEDEEEELKRIAAAGIAEDKKRDKTGVNVRMDNIGGGGQRLPPDGDEFPLAYQEYTTGATIMSGGGGIDSLDGTCIRATTNYSGSNLDARKKTMAMETTSSGNSSGSGSFYESDASTTPPPPLPASDPPVVRKYSPSGDLWRQDNKSEKSVKDKIAMFSSQTTNDAPSFRSRLSKHKSSDDVFAEDKSTLELRAQSTYDLSVQKPPSLPRTSPPPATQTSSFNGYKPTYSTPSRSPTTTTTSNGLARATSFSGSCVNLLPASANVELTTSNGNNATTIARTNSLASTFRRPSSINGSNSDEARKSSLNQLIEQRRKGISKLRGLVIPEKDAVAVEQSITDLPEIKSRDSILVNQVSRANIQDKWGSQSSLASNASTVSSSLRPSNGNSSGNNNNNGAFKMPAPKILSSYSPAFKRKSLSVYSPITTSSNSTSNNKAQQQLGSPDAPKSLESICSPTRSDYSFDFVSSSAASPDNGNPATTTTMMMISTTTMSNNNNNKPSKGSAGGRNEYADSDNDSAVSSSQSSISRGFSPEPATYQLIVPEKTQTSVYTSARAQFLSERSFSTAPTSKQQHQQQQQTQPQQKLSSESLRILKPQSVEAINRKNILASARCRSGRDLNLGSPLIQRKFNEDGVEQHDEREDAGGEFTAMSNGDNAREVKIAYIEITENVAGENKRDEDELAPPRLPPKRSNVAPATTRNQMPIPTARATKATAEFAESSSDMRSWMRAEMRALATTASVESTYGDRRKADSQSNNYKSSGEIIEATIDSGKLPPPRHDFKRDVVDEQEDLLTVLTTKSRSRSGIHVEETNYGRLRSPMSLEDILAARACESSSPSKLPRSQSVIERNGIASSTPVVSRPTSLSASSASARRSNSTNLWSVENNKIETNESSKSKIPMPRNLNRRSSSVTDMKKVFERPTSDVGSPPSGATSPAATGSSSLSSSSSHNRFPSLDSSSGSSSGSSSSSSADQGPIGCSEQFGSISSLASSTSLISQQELAQLVEEANLEEPRVGHDVVVVLLHKDNPTGSVGIILAGGADCETKEITVHRVLSHSVADKEGSVQRGDRILSINGRSMRGLTHRESLAVLKQPRPEVVLVVSRLKLDDSKTLRASRAESVETIVEGYETTTTVSNTAWGPSVAVAVYKDGAGLGFSLEGGRDSPLGDRPLLIKKIFTGGAAEKTGALRAGDQLLEVNKRDVSRLSRIEAWSLMKKLPDGEVNLLVRHPATKSS